MIVRPTAMAPALFFLQRPGERDELRMLPNAGEIAILLEMSAAASVREVAGIAEFAQHDDSLANESSSWAADATAPNRRETWYMTCSGMIRKRAGDKSPATCPRRYRPSAANLSGHLVVIGGGLNIPRPFTAATWVARLPDRSACRLFRLSPAAEEIDHDEGAFQEGGMDVSFLLLSRRCGGAAMERRAEAEGTVLRAGRPRNRVYIEIG